MATTGRYCYCPAAGKTGRRVTLMDRFRKWRRERLEEKPDVRYVIGYNHPVYPSGWGRR